MKKIECENLIKSLMKDIWEVYKEYNPNGTYLSMSIIDSYDETGYSCSNEYYEDGADVNKPLNMMFEVDKENENG